MIDMTSNRDDSLLEDSQPLIVIVSNRGPFSFKANEAGGFSAKRGAGGLVTALSGLAEKQNVLWIASALSQDDKLWAKHHAGKATTIEGIDLQLVQPESEEQYNQYYNVISNPLLWFIQHQLWDTPRKPDITEETWQAWNDGYVSLNRHFANVVVNTIEGTKRPIIIFPQDYHLYMLPHFLRERLGYQVHIQPFIHIPWPGPDAWRVLPSQMREAIIRSLLMSNQIGFQTQRDAFNFVQTGRFYLDDAHSHGSRDSLHYGGRKVQAKTYPISVDVDELQAIANDPETHELEQTVKNFISGRKLILRIDRVEPSKNILRGLRAYRALLETHPEHRVNVQMIALLVPSRMEVDEYHDYLQDVVAEAGLINAEYSDGTWEPVRILLGNNYPRAIAAMRLYDVLLVNPLADGMNLVAKEGVLVNQNDGALVLSEHAGAFYELGDEALTISPFDTFGTAEALHKALKMPSEERQARADHLRQKVENASVKQWFYTQVEDALHAFNNHAKNASTSAISETMTSAASRTESGMSGD